MDFSWITPSLLIALLALWVAYSNYRRNNFAVVRLRSCVWSHKHSVSENHAQPFHQLRIVLQNIGIPLHNLGLALRFSGADGSGRISLPLRADGGSLKREGQFAKGMITDFALKSCDLDTTEQKLLIVLRDPGKQAASLCLYSDGFLAWEYRLDGWFVPAKRLWNRLAVKANFLFKSTKGQNAQGLPIVKYYSFLPMFTLPSQDLLQMIDYLAREQDQRQCA